MSWLRRVTGKASEASERSQPSADVARRAAVQERFVGTGVGEPIGRVVTEVAALGRAGRFAEAFALTAKALEQHPGNTDLLFARGSALLDWGRFRQARAVYEQAERHGLRSATLFLQLGWACLNARDLPAAEASFRKAIAADAKAFKPRFCLGVVHQMQNRHEEAVAAFEDAASLDPGDFDTQLMRGNSLLELADASAAEACFRRGLEIDSSRAAGWTNLGFALARQDRSTEAVAAFERAHELEAHDGSSDVDAFFNLAVGYADTGRIDDAFRLFEAHLPRRPLPVAHFNYGVFLLGQGKLAEAWPHHEFRWLMEPLLSMRPQYGKPPWQGQDLRGKTVLIRAEQGIGDTIQMLRYVPMLKALGAKVFLRAPAGMEELGRGVDGMERVLGQDEPNPEFDFYVNTLSLPAAFGTTLESIPANVPYCRVDDARRERWRSRLDGGTGLRVGIVWAGSPAHVRDRYRSITLSRLAPLFAAEGIRFFALQKGPALSEFDAVTYPGVVSLGPELSDLADTAAVIAELDLVIGVDTAVVHLAGAVAKPVWLMLPRRNDWRWLDARSDSPWYPSMRLFRQSRQNDWDEVVRNVAAELRRLVREPAVAGSATVAHSSPAPVVSPATFPALAMRRPGFSALVDARPGLLQYFPGDGSCGRSIEHYGEYLQLQLDLLSRIVRSGMTVLEVCPGVGAHALALSRMVGEGGNVIAVEPRPLPRRALRQNVRTNGTTNITVLPADAGGRRREVGAGAGAGPAVPEAVDALQLDRLDLLKIGSGIAAKEILASASDTLWRLRPVLFVAAEGGSESNPVADQIRQFGYRCWRIDTPFFNPANFNCWGVDVFEGATAAAILAIAEEIDVELDISEYPEITN